MYDAGFGVVRGLVRADEIHELLDATSTLGESAHGVRRLFQQIPFLLEMARTARMVEAVRPFAGDGARPVRALFFDKNRDANWKVPWHQDLTIAVSSRCEKPGYGRWSVKDGELHVQPPVDLLKTMAAIRIHLDDCGETNGPLRVVPGSHKRGRIPEKNIRETADRLGEVVCTAGRGDAIVMSPLLLHASSQASEPLHRRVIHIEYCGGELPDGLEWAEV